MQLALLLLLWLPWHSRPLKDYAVTYRITYTFSQDGVTITYPHGQVEAE